jgi:NitT/TauT family transport system substrate-binding protein
MILLRILSRILTIAVIAGFLGCSSPPPEPLRIGTELWPGHEPLRIARHRNLVSKEDFHILEYPSQSEMIRAFKNGSLDIACLTLDETLMLSQTDDLEIILILDYSNGADAIFAQSSIHNIKELTGKTIGMEKTSVQSYLLSRALEISGLRTSDVTIVPYELFEQERAFLDKRVDAVVTYEPIRMRLRKSGAKVLFDSSEIPREIMDVMVVRRSNPRLDRRRMGALISAWFKGVGSIKNEIDTVCSFIDQHLDLQGNECRDVYQGIHFLTLEENRRAFAGRARRLTSDINKIAARMSKVGLLGGAIDTTALSRSGRFFPERRS